MPAIRLFLSLCLALAAPLFATAGARADEVRIGVLALRGEERVVADWTATAAYLGRHLPHHDFTIVPLGFEEVHLAVRQQRVDFVLANSSYYVELETLYGVSPVLTLRNRIDGGEATSAFGGVVFTRADRHDLRTLDDLAGRSFGAVSPSSLGGWQAAWHELRSHGIDPERRFARLEFFGTHDAVVLAVRDGRVAAGTARTGTLESMAREGSIDLADFYVLGEKRAERFPFLLSTDLYPEWPLARLPGVSESLAVELAVALLQMPADHPAALASHSAGWTLPLNYQPVHDILRALRVGPYEHLRHLSPGEVLRQYWQVALSVLLAGLLGLGAALYFVRLNRRLRTQQAELGRLNASLEARVQERTARVETLLGREQHLRAIVETVADVNQIIITSDNAEDMLKASCDRLIAHRDYRFAWVALERDGRLQPAARSYGSAEHIRRLVALGPDDPATRAVRDNRSTTGKLEEAGQDGADPPITAVAALPLRPDAFAPPIGALCVATAHGPGFDGEETEMLEQLAGDLGFALHAFGQRSQAARLQQERIHNYEETILSLVDMIEKRDTYTAGHTRRVAEYCALIGTQLGLGRDELANLTHAATLHDIGKIVIPDAVLLKPGRLTALEYELIKQHVTAGYETLKGVAMYRDLAEIMRHHHEWVDGSGYPGGLKGDEIPFLSRIMAVADAFDAMTSHRIYKPRKSVHAALAELRSLAGRHYDPRVVEAAAIALADVTPPASEDQIPRTALERQRFAYFFNDQLTGAWNAAYLEFVLRNGLPEGQTRACMVLLHDFSAFNARSGWSEGDRLLHDFAAWLMRTWPQASVFRVMGDDFLLLGEFDDDCSADRINSESPLAGSPVAVELRPLDLTGGRLDDLRQLLGTAQSVAAA